MISKTLIFFRCTAFLLLCMCGLGCDMNDKSEIKSETPMLNEILAAKSNKNQLTNVSEIVEKYIPLGSDTNKALKLLSDGNFHYQLLDDRAPESDLYDQIYLASFYVNDTANLGIGHVIEITLKTKNNSVEKITAVLTYRHM